ncbi:asparaginase [Punctularia strigosozonata HHB-11173 SS5]|uniref:asparaginase n=1 Tax=Punctularia strigosozonata (strain HHB-11173) TaxID=741275 RepID=UPI00044180A8|nr:asparaginase [Punctularia strigosozonata HHB-11173 SS5]EIN11455.1 asparaginase [Punctularia strigosozonata HHB-11173 SS5]
MTSYSPSEKDALLAPKAPPNWKKKYTLVIHGGAGTMSRESATPERQALYRAALKKALRSGYDVLRDGGEAMDAVVAAVTVMEDCPLFNAAHGAVFNVAGKNELEASLMLSTPPSSESHPAVPASRRGASATLLTRARNPSQLVRALYLAPADAVHPFLSASTAEDIGARHGATLVDPSYFWTKNRWLEHRRGLGLPDEPFPPHSPSSSSPVPDKEKEQEKGEWDVEEELELNLDVMPTGTVGAVALDVRGCIAACTSTGGRTNKLVGRIGDTPHKGSGYWAEEWKVKGWIRKKLRKIHGKSSKKAVGVSGTGDGDYFIRQATASTIARRMQFLNESVDKAARHAVEDLRKDGGIGGVIALDEEGNVAMPLNCSGMYRGIIREDGVPKAAIFDDEELS